MTWGVNSTLFLLPTDLVSVSPKRVANPQAFLTRRLTFETQKVKYRIHGKFYQIISVLSGQVTNTAVRSL